MLLFWYLISPDTFNSVMTKVAEKIGAKSDPGVAVTKENQARFVQYTGRVQVKKRDSTQWINADYGTTLDKGDLIQTSGDSLARITFADGTTFTVKPDTLITVEENTVAPDRSTRTGVKISTGAVDLTTSTYEVPGSSAKVSFGDALATLRDNSRAAVRSDPSTNQHEITVSQGTAEVARGGEQIQLGQWERANFASGGAVSKSRVLAPPELVEPLNLYPLSSDDPRREAIRFRWKPVAGAVSFHLRISSSMMFTKVAAEKRVQTDSAVVSGLDPGDYFWAVIATDAQGRNSEPSNTYKFTLAAKGKSAEMLLEVDRPQIHGTVVEVTGRTEPAAALIINGQTVTNIKPDGKFQHFTPPMPRGSQKIVIAAQNRRGGIANRTIDIVIP